MTIYIATERFYFTYGNEPHNCTKACLLSVLIQVVLVATQTEHECNSNHNFQQHSCPFALAFRLFFILLICIFLLSSTLLSDICHMSSAYDISLLCVPGLFMALSKSLRSCNNFVAIKIPVGQVLNEHGPKDKTHLFS